MNIEHIVTFAIALFVLIVASKPLGELLRIPEALVLLVLGATTGALVISGLGIDTGLRAESFHDIVFFVFLPVLVFDAALHLPQRAVLDDALVISYLAVLGVAITAVFAGYLIYVGIDHSSGFPFIAALLVGTLLAATDPVSVVGQLKTLNAPERLRVILEGESLFNDATAIALFSVLLAIALEPQVGFSFSAAATSLIVNFAGGTAVGIVIGLAGCFVLRHIDDEAVDAVTSLAIAYGSFVVAEAALHVSGILAVTAAGITVARLAEAQVKGFSGVWRLLTRLSDGSIFLLMGLVVGWYMFEQRWVAMLIAIGAVTIARLVITVGGISLLNLFQSQPLTMNYQAVLVWGGLRGSVSLALALSIPVELPYWFTIQCMAFGVVLFTMLVQAPTLPLLLRRTGLTQ